MQAASTAFSVDEKYKKLVMMAGVVSVATALSLIVMKFFAWYISLSSSVLASLTDSLVDLLVSMINLMALKFAMTPADREHRFGHFKAESLASLAQASFIASSAALLVFHGLKRLNNPQELTRVDDAIVVSFVALLLTAALVLFQSYVYSKTKSQAIGADRMHYLSDLLFNAGVIAVLVIVQRDYLWADGFFAALLGLVILKSSYSIARKAISELLDRSLSPEEHDRIMKAILSVPEIITLHDLKTRRAGPRCFIQCHIVLPCDMPLLQVHEIVDRVEGAVMEDFPDAEITIHMEPDQDKTFREVNFLDHTSCEVQRSHYLDSKK